MDEERDLELEEEEEDEELETAEKVSAFRKQQKGRRWALTVKRVLIVSIIICILLALWTFRKQILSESFYERLQISIAEMSYGSDFPQEIRGNSVLPDNFLKCGDNIALMSDSAMSVISEKGKVLHDAQHSYLSPRLAASRTRWLMYDAGNKKYSVEKYAGDRIEGETEQRIITADITESGKYAIVTFAQSFVSEMKVYLSNGSLQYQYSFASGYVTCMDLDETGRHAVVCTTSSREGELVSALYYFDFENPEPVSVLEYKDTVFFAAQCGEESACCIGDNRLVFLSSSGEEIGRLELSDAEIEAYAFSDSSCALAWRDYAGSSKGNICVFNSSGEESLRFEATSRITDIDLCGSTLAVLSGGLLSAYDCTTGGKVSVNEVGLDAVNIELYSSEDAYVLSLTQIRKISIT